MIHNAILKPRRLGRNHLSCRQWPGGFGEACLQLACRCRARLCLSVSERSGQTRFRGIAKGRGKIIGNGAAGNNGANISLRIGWRKAVGIITEILLVDTPKLNREIGRAAVVGCSVADSSATETWA